jgi:hypothetical protein
VTAKVEAALAALSASNCTNFWSRGWIGRFLLAS